MTARKVIWFPRKLSDATLARARSKYEVIVNEADTLSSADELILMSAKVDAIVPCHSEIFSADIVNRLDDRLKIVANHSVGVDHCDLPAFATRGIAVTNTPDVLSDATAEIAMLLLLGAARRAYEGDNLVRSGAWDFWSPSFMVGKQVTGSRLGIVGMGRVGQALAKRARGFDMQVHYFNRSRLSAEFEQGAQYHSSLGSLLAVSDFLSLHCPATPETTGILDRQAIDQLPDGAVVVNTARGSLVVEDALLEALSSGKLFGAGLDCFASEPGGNAAMAEHSNIFLLPHIGSATERTRDAMGFRALDNLDAFFAGKKPQDLL